MFRIKKQNLIKIVLSLIFIIGLFAHSRSLFGEEVIKEFQPSIFVIIQSKTMDVIVTANMRFLIKPYTKIHNRNGKEISIYELPVPCSAKVRYQPSNNGDPEALKILVSRVLPGAVTEWVNQSPE